MVTVQLTVSTVVVVAAVMVRVLSQPALHSSPGHQAVAEQGVVAVGRMTLRPHYCEEREW
jgi:hypothetical protein